METDGDDVSQTGDVSDSILPVDECSKEDRLISVQAVVPPDWEIFTESL